MTRDEFDGLVRRLEEAARRSPRRYLAGVLGLLMLAYGYLSLVLVGSLGVVLGTITMVLVTHSVVFIKLAILLVVAAGGLFWAVLRGLWVKLEPPEGLPVTPAQAPALFCLLDELRTALDCRPFHEVLLVAEHNAAVVQVPRLGVFGWHRNYLLLGLPLMHDLGPDEFKAVLAHEFAHSSRGHGRFGNWLYRLRESWERIFEQMAKQRTRGAFVLTSFLSWFWPRFNAHAFVLARANEYEADACGVRLAGADAMAHALMRLPVGDSLLSEKFWPGVFAYARQEKEPPANVMLALAAELKNGLPPEESGRRLRQAFLMETNNADTHPCLKDRLRAIGRLPAEVDRGEAPSGPPSPARSAAECFLGAHAEVAARQISEHWRTAVAPQWQARHERTQTLEQELLALDQPPESPPDAGRLWEKARRLMELHDDAAAMPVLEQVLSVKPDHAAASFVCGRYWLEREDARGIGLIEAALNAEPTLTPEGCNLLYGYYVRSGQRHLLRSVEDRMDRFREESERAQKERHNVTAKDTFLPHGLGPERMAQLREVFRSEPEIGAAAVARKEVRHFPQEPCYAVALRIKVAWWKPRSSSANQKVVHRVLERIQMDGYVLVFVQEQNLKALGKKVFAVEGATVYDRSTERRHERSNQA